MSNSVHPLQAGDRAPDFELQATGDRQLKLSDFRGQKNVLLAFYPFDWSPTCSLQLPGLQEKLIDFRSLNTEVLGVSIDSRHSHRAFAERALFVIDKQGVIRYAHVNPMGEVPDNGPVFDVLRQLEAQG